MVKTSTVRDILNYLLHKQGISEVFLGRETGIPRATINRITSGRTIDPRASTLNAIATYFNISTEQLLGVKPILLEKEQAPTTMIPLLDWDETKNWAAAVAAFYPMVIHSESVQADFALTFKGESMAPQFQEPTLLLVSTTRPAKNNDYVIAHLHQRDEIVFRKLIVENNYKILKALNRIFPPIQLEPADKIIGTIIQTRTNY